jgi:hypothetical protein
VPTYDLRKATYTSQYVHFSEKEIRDKDKAPLDALDAEEQRIIDQFNPMARFPFVMINGQYTQLGSGYPPNLIDGMEFETLRKQVTSGEKNPATDAIAGEAKIITTYICHSTGGQPESVCKM